ncbi:MAG: hypothetical protein HY900_21650 [Deltaproteobacteria bacterium]|nr:hypothetical protein [Deltaproteobacteria bacterium]
MGNQEFCCDAAAARAIRKLTLSDGGQVGIVNLEGILQDVAALGLTEQDAIAKELCARVEARNYVPRGYEGEYSGALLAEYNRRNAKLGA